MSTSPGLYSPNFVFPANTAKSNDYFMIDSSSKLTVNTNLQHPLTGLSNLNISTAKDVPSPCLSSAADSDDMLHRKLRVSPLTHKSFNDSLSSLTSDSTVADSFISKHKQRTDSINSGFTLVGDSPTKLSVNLITENQETSFNFGLSPNQPKYRSNSLGVVHHLPQPLVKSLTNPSLKTIPDYHKKADFVPQILALSPAIKILEKDDVRNLFSKVKTMEETGLPNLLVFDIRPFSDYIRNHITNAINISMPSTLLKRQNFSFNRCINSLPVYEKMIIKTYFNYHLDNQVNDRLFESLGDIPCGLNGFPSIFIYDNTCNTSATYFMIKKMIEEYKLRTIDIYIVNQNFSDISDEGSVPLESGTNQNFDINTMIAEDTHLCDDISINASPKGVQAPDRLRSRSLQDVSSLGLVSPVESSTPVLSNFKLPTIRSSFKIRHNEEAVTQSKLGYNLWEKYGNSLNDKVPAWFNEGNLTEDSMVDAFNKIEVSEKNRLNDAFSSNNQMISSGIEKGLKNRYKDIFLFEHLRVKLIDYNDGQITNPTCDYINASYIDSLRSLPFLNTVNSNYFRYVATQGPLEHTVGDFYKCILNNQVAVVICLTDEWENGVVKCHPYWKNGVYKSNNNEIKIEVLKVSQLSTNLLARHLKVTCGNVEQTLIQLQLLNWMDNEVCNTIYDLLFVLKLKNHLIEKLNLHDYSTLVHCSAGCGRTGTLITVDTIFNLLNMNTLLETDVIPQIVDNLRCQRLSMVQNLRQYISVYEILIKSFISSFEFNLDVEIVNEFKNFYKYK